MIVIKMETDEERILSYLLSVIKENVSSFLEQDASTLDYQLSTFDDEKTMQCIGNCLRFFLERAKGIDDDNKVTAELLKEGNMLSCRLKRNEKSIVPKKKSDPNPVKNHLVEITRSKEIPEKLFANSLLEPICNISEIYINI